MIRKISVFFVHLACIIYFNLKIVGKENVPKEGAYILCANHKSNWDPPLVVSSIKRKMYVMAKQELFKNKFIPKPEKKNKSCNKPLAIPIKTASFFPLIIE